MSDERPRPERDATGQFAKGSSGNPGGRPRGEMSKLREHLAKDAEQVADTVIAAALDGDMAAAKIVLDRLVPPLRAVAPKVEFPLPDELSPVALGEIIFKEVAAGHLSPDVASQLVGALGQMARISEVTDLRERLEALEIALKPESRKR